MSCLAIPGISPGRKWRPGSHTWLHRRVPLTSAFANCLTTAAPQFVSRNASIPTAAPLTHRNDLGLRGSRAEDDIGREKMQSNVGRHIRRSHRWPPLCTAQRAGSGIGANLARMEIKLIFNELADQIPDIAKLAEPQRLRSAGSTASRTCGSPTAADVPTIPACAPTAGPVRRPSATTRPSRGYSTPQARPSTSAARTSPSPTSPARSA